MKNTDDASSYVGLWVTADNYVRQELLPGGRYVEARGTTEQAYTGRYTITGTHIDYADDSGFTADGDFINEVPPPRRHASVSSRELLGQRNLTHRQVAEGRAGHARPSVATRAGPPT